MFSTRALLQTCMLASAAGVAAYQTAEYYDPMHPERPIPIDGLFYDMYEWVGSYVHSHVHSAFLHPYPVA
jgi:hypothetical protein